MANTVYNFSFNDPNQAYTAYYPQITAGIAAAASAWKQYLSASAPTTIDIVIAFDPTIRTSPDSPGVQLSTSSFAYAGSANGRGVYEVGLAPKLTTGVDPNGSAPDVTITINPQLLGNNLWFDPDPVGRTAPIPAGQTDAQSVLLRLMGRAFAFNGFLDPNTGSPPATYESAYDRYVTSINGGLYFTGPHAEAVYGGPVPLTSGNYFDLGNAAPRAGSNIVSDLMGGAGIAPGTRYSISALDVAVLQDYTSSSGISSPAGSPGTLASGVFPDIGVYRFLDTKFGTHFYSNDPNEIQVVKQSRPDLQYEGLSLFGLNPSNNDPNAVTVYRFLDTKFGTHFYSSDANEVDVVKKSRPDLSFEGPSFYEHATSQPGDVAVYRYLDTIHGTHFYSADSNERANIANTRPDLQLEGIGFYAPSA